MAFSSSYDFDFKRDKSRIFLIIVLGFLMYCMTVTAISGIFTYQQTNDWKTALHGKLTIEFPSNVDGVKEILTEKQKGEVISVVQSTPGISYIRQLKDSDVLRIVEPWLSSTAIPDDFPFPILFDVGINKNVSVDLLGLTSRLAKISSGVRIHDHSKWYTPIENISLSLFGFAMLLLILMLLTVCSTTIFITKKTLQVHRDVVKNLQLIGAKDSYISAQFKRYYFDLGLKGALLSVLLSLLSIAGITYIANAEPFSFMNMQYSAVSVIVPMLVVLLIMLTSRSTVIYFLKREDWVD